MQFSTIYIFISINIYMYIIRNPTITGGKDCACIQNKLHMYMNNYTAAFRTAFTCTHILLLFGIVLLLLFVVAFWTSIEFY